MEKELIKFIDNLKEEKREMAKERAFMHKHKFERERNYINDKMQILEQIIWGLEELSKEKKADNIRFEFNSL